VIYRPHFAYPTPLGCRDEQFEYYYDTSNMVVTSVPALGPLFSVIFGPLDKDAEFRWRGVRIGLNRTAYGLAVMWRDAMGNQLSDAPVNIELYAIGAGFANNFGGGVSVPWEEEIICPPGSHIESTWTRELNTAGNVPPLPGVTLLGVKRYYDSAVK
jgi:hypothetical protein